MTDARSWLRLVNKAKLSAATTRYALWLANRPVKGRPGHFRGGQESAATELGYTDRTIRRAELALIDAGLLVRVERGVKHRKVSVFRMSTGHGCPVDNAVNRTLGVRLKTGVNRTEMSATMCTSATRTTTAPVTQPAAGDGAEPSSPLTANIANTRLRNGERDVRFTEHTSSYQPSPIDNATTAPNHRLTGLSRAGTRCGGMRTNRTEAVA